MPAAPIAKEAIKWLLGVIAALAAERALDSYELDDIYAWPGKPKDVDPRLWAEMRNHYNAMCDCADDPEALELCRDRMIAEIEASITRRRAR